MANVDSILLFFVLMSLNQIYTIWFGCVLMHTLSAPHSSFSSNVIHLYFGAVILFLNPKFELILYWSTARTTTTTNEPMCQVKIDKTKKNEEQKTGNHIIRLKSIQFNSIFLRFWIQCKLCMWITVCVCAVCVFSRNVTSAKSGR